MVIHNEESNLLIMTSVKYVLSDDIAGRRGGGACSQCGTISQTVAIMQQLVKSVSRLSAQSMISNW